MLIIEDDFIQGQDLELLLRSRGHTVCGVVTTGEAALLLAKTRHPDVALVDVNLMGQLDGIETAKRIAAQHRCHVIFVTGNSAEEVLGRLDVLAPDAVMRKPLSGRAVLAAVERAAGKR